MTRLGEPGGAAAPSTTTPGKASGSSPSATSSAPLPAACAPLRFPGQYYDPETGRYTSPDPLGLGPAPNPVAYRYQSYEQQWILPDGREVHVDGGPREVSNEGGPRM
ncbi:hypothetical protein [Streptomyces bobili]|uniref:hypothetical protein n=1 Tax=Streptomyces bobili TaxID=67280 RepID=UPI00378CE192